MEGQAARTVIHRPVCKTSPEAVARKTCVPFLGCAFPSSVHLTLVLHPEGEHVLARPLPQLVLLKEVTAALRADHTSVGVEDQRRVQLISSVLDVPHEHHGPVLRSV